MYQIQKFFRKTGKALQRFFRRVRKGSPLDIAILAVTCLLVVVLIAILVMTLAGAKEPVSTPSSTVSVSESYDMNANSLAVEEYDGTVLPKTEDAGQEYVDNTLFIGDSNTERMVVYGATTWENNLGVTGMGIQDVTGTPTQKFSGYSSLVLVPKAVEMLQPQRIIITFGTNNTGWSADVFAQQYKKALDAIHEAYPYADIIINAVSPVAKERAYPNISMQTIDSFNQALLELAREEGYTFLNSSEALKDASTGYAKSGYMVSDGVHLSQTGMDALMEYIRTHAHETEDTRPTVTNVPTHVAPPDGLFVTVNEPESSSSSSSSSSSEAQGKVKVVFSVAGDTAGGSLSGTLQQEVAPGSTCSAVTANVNSGYAVTWGCSVGTISNVNNPSLSFNVPAYVEGGTTITVTASFKKTVCEHVYDAGVITTQPTCGAAGVKTFTCTKCQATYTEQVPATGAHNFSILVSETPAQVGVDGSRVYQCSVCGAPYTEVIPALPAPPSSSTAPPPSSPPTSTPTNSTPTGTETNSTAQPAA